MTIQSPRVALSLLLLVSFIWGSEFVLIDLAVAQLPTNTFNTIRFILAAIALLPLFWLSREKILASQRLKLLLSGTALGFLLFIGFYTQTEGLRFTTVSNAGFITGLCVPLVPVLGFLLFRRKVGINVWFGVLIATVGLYLLTISEEFALSRGDTLVLICAFAFAGHIILTDRLVSDLPVTALSIIQLFAVAVFSLIAGVLSPEPAFHYADMNPSVWYEQLTQPIVIAAILIAGILGTAYAFWAQVACQTIIEPHKVALVFAAEPVFAHISAWLFLDEHLETQGWIGAGLIISAMLVSELGDKRHPPKIEPLDQTTASH